MGHPILMSGPGAPLGKGNAQLGSKFLASLTSGEALLGVLRMGIKGKGTPVILSPLLFEDKLEAGAGPKSTTTINLKFLLSAISPPPPKHV